MKKINITHIVNRLLQTVNCKLLSAHCSLKILLTTYCLLLCCQLVNAQVYPVQVTPQLIPPYSLKLSDYQTTSSEKLFVNILLTDTQDSGRQVRLKMYIEGQGFNIQTLDFVAGATPIFLDGGVNLRLSNLDLRPYFSLNNLLGITPQQYNQPLPDGRYDFCFEIYDQFSGQRLSQKRCASVFLILNDPPILNVPNRGDLVTAQNPQNIIFNWTPRHLNATGVQYEFTLKELWDTGLDPQAAFLASPPLYQETTFAPTLLYGPANIQLLEGKVYGWQVRALVSDGISETSVFRNNGFSEIYHFKYEGNCAPPQFILSEAQNSQTVEITWQYAPHIRYEIQYRKKGYGDADWFSLYVYNNQHSIHNLEAGITYEFRVGGECTPFGGFAFSPIYEFTTPTEEETAYYNCGVLPEVEITNQNPLQNIGVNEVFTAGDFPVTVKEVINSSGGVFNGWGFITVPYLGDTRIRVEFYDIHINTDYQLIQGVVQTSYDPNWEGIGDIDDAIDYIVGDDGEIDEFDATDIDISDVEVDDDGNIVLIDEDGNPHPIDVDTPVVITDENGDQWLVDEDGNVTELGEEAEGGAPTDDNTNGVSSSGDVTEISSEDVTVLFTPSGFYGTDLVRQDVQDSRFTDKYERIPQASGGNYNVLYKAVSNAPQPTDQLIANAIFSNGKTSDDIVFKTKQGTAVPATWQGNIATLTIEKQYDFAKDEILATVKPADSAGNYDIAGKVNVWHLKQQQVNLTIVPVGNGLVSNTLADELNTIYNPVGVHFNVTVDSPITIGQNIWDENGNGQLDIGDSTVLANYTAEERAIYNYYKTQRPPQNQMYYVFVLGNDITTTDSSTEGFMPLKRQYGFVFNPNNAARAIAHELGHGVFGLEHPFTEYNITQGSTDLLMDYGTGTAFTHMDWQTIHAPGLQLYLFQGDDDGEFASLSIVADFDIDTDYPDANQPPTFPDCYTFNMFNNQTIISFEENHKNIITSYDVTPNKLLRSIKVGQNSLGKIQGDYKPSYGITLNDDNTIVERIPKLRFVCFDCINQEIASGNETSIVRTTVTSENGSQTYSYTNITSKYTIPVTSIDCEVTSKVVYSFNGNNEGLCVNAGCAPNNDERCPQMNYDLQVTQDIQDIISEKVNNAITQIDNSKTNLVRTKGAFNHIFWTDGGGSALSNDDEEWELLEDKFHLLSHYKSNTYFILGLIRTINNSLYSETQLQQIASSAISGSDKDVVLVLVNASSFQSLLGVTTTVCVSSGYSESRQGIISDEYITTTGDNLKDIVSIYTSVEKPLYLRRFYLKADKGMKETAWEVAQRRGFNTIHRMEFYKSVYYDQIKSIRNDIYWTMVGYGMSENHTPAQTETYINTIQDLHAQIRNKYDLAKVDEIDLDVSGNAQTWQSWQPDNLGKLREPYVIFPETARAYFVSQTQEWGYGEKFIIFDGFNGQLNAEEHFYGFDQYEVIDPIVYGVADVISMIPIPYVDSLGDGLGLLYATYRGDASQAPFYSLGLALPVGAGYLKIGSKAVDNLYVITAKRLDDGGVQLEKRFANAVPDDEIPVTTILPEHANQVDDILTELDNPQFKDQIIKFIDNAPVLDDFAALFSLLDDTWDDALRTALNTDIQDGTDVFRALLNNSDDFVKHAEAWKNIRNARGANSAFKTDVALLNKVADLKQNTTFMQRISGDEGLEKIIQNNVRAPCKTCTGGSKYLKDMDEYLDDVAHFVDNFYDVNDAQRLITELKNGAQNTLEGGAYVVRVFKENPNGLFNLDNAAEIDLRFSEDVLNRFDVKFSNGFGEFKSYQINSVGNVSVNQLKEYLSDPLLNSLDDLNYMFDKRKLLSEYGTGTFSNIDEATDAVKQRMKTVFENNAEELFKANEDLFKQFDGIDGDDIENWEDFYDLISDSNLPLNHPIFNFVTIN